MTLRVLILSDLHLELGRTFLSPEIAYDVVVLAGDIHSPGTEGVRWAAKSFECKPVLYVPGNHEFYGTQLESELMAMRETAVGTCVQVLHRDVVAVNEIRFVGSTLWTDFALPVAEARSTPGIPDTNPERALAAANNGISDFIEIMFGARKLRAQDTLVMHATDRKWLAAQLSSNDPRPTVVVTHHAPSRGSIDAQYASDWRTPAYVSDLPSGFFVHPSLWVHGHTHTSFDYFQGNCRVVANPRGYVQRDGTGANPRFNPAFIARIRGRNP